MRAAMTAYIRSPHACTFYGMYEIPGLNQRFCPLQAVI